MNRNALALLLGLVVLVGLTVAQTAPSARQPKTQICHRTKSAKHPYVKLSVGKSVLKGHLRHAADIIPAPAEGCPTTVLSATQGWHGASRHLDRRQRGAGSRRS